MHLGFPFQFEWLFSCILVAVGSFRCLCSYVMFSIIGFGLQCRCWVCLMVVSSNQFTWLLILVYRGYPRLLYCILSVVASLDVGLLHSCWLLLFNFQLVFFLYPFHVYFVYFFVFQNLTCFKAQGIVSLGCIVALLSNSFSYLKFFFLLKDL